jgi:hypothetical protein
MPRLSASEAGGPGRGGVALHGAHRARGQDELVSVLEVAKLLGDQGWHHPHDAVCLAARSAS